MSDAEKMLPIWDEVAQAVADALSNGEGRASAYYLEYHFMKAGLSVFRLPDDPPALQAQVATLRAALEQTQTYLIQGAYGYATALVNDTMDALSTTGSEAQAVLEAALEAARAEVALWKQPGEDWNEAFERVAEMFRRDTGYLRPGKSVPDAMYYDGLEEERKEAWEKWRAERQENLITALARLDAARKGE